MTRIWDWGTAIPHYQFYNMFSLEHATKYRSLVLSLFFQPLKWLLQNHSGSSWFCPMLFTNSLQRSLLPRAWSPKDIITFMKQVNRTCQSSPSPQAPYRSLLPVIQLGNMFFPSFSRLYSMLTNILYFRPEPCASFPLPTARQWLIHCKAYTSPL